MADRLYSFIILSVVFFDQFSKFYVLSHYKLDTIYTLNKYIGLCPVLHFTEEDGLSIFFTHFDIGYGEIVFSVAFVVIGLLFVFAFVMVFNGMVDFIKQGHKELIAVNYGIMLTIGGIIGNTIDRFTLRGVPDFILFEWTGTGQVVDCNTADLFIWFGTLMIGLALILKSVQMLIAKFDLLAYRTPSCGQDSVDDLNFSRSTQHNVN